MKIRGHLFTSTRRKISLCLEYFTIPFKFRVQNNSKITIDYADDDALFYDKTIIWNISNLDIVSVKCLWIGFGDIKFDELSDILDPIHIKFDPILSKEGFTTISNFRVKRLRTDPKINNDHWSRWIRYLVNCNEYICMV